MRIILSGFGAVGQSLVGLLSSRAEDLYTEYALKPRIVGVFDSGGGAADPAGLDPAAMTAAKRDAGTVSAGLPGGVEMIRSVDADVLVEATASNYADAEPGISHITTAMGRGMHVVSVNKGPLALAFPSLTEIAAYNNVALRFSGTVGGGTPILDYAKNSLRGERITSFAGILNGTTNYILSSMASGLSAGDALADARKRGYVEADESLDLDGIDAAAKLVILANWVMGMKVTLPDVGREGIRGVTGDDVAGAASRGRAVKLVASCKDGLKVGPEEVPLEDPLCVNGTLNAISFTSEHSGTQTIIGRGAGGTETASSILRDLLDVRQVMS
ncbi:MAG: homoserine dehydrogenase [Nitrosopumilus sp.]|nr:homoserine dehydrogenase [Nitrosopumilus sp.]MDA7957787.1 homoserine dehydrogenase [Nitrosopumilus sp.]